MDPQNQPSGRYWHSSHHTIYPYTALPFESKPAGRLRPNPCHRAFVLNYSACCLNMVSNYANVQSTVDAAIQSCMPFIHTLSFRLTQNQGGNCAPIPAAVQLYRILQHVVFICCPCTRTSSHPADASKQCIMSTVSGAATTATPMLPPSPTGPQSSSRYSSTKLKIN
jgi:hypothetical protein